MGTCSGMDRDGGSSQRRDLGNGKRLVPVGDDPAGDYAVDRRHGGKTRMYIAMEEKDAKKLREAGVEVVIAKYILYKAVKEAWKLTQDIIERQILYGEE